MNVSHSTSGFAQFSYAGGGSVGDFNNDGWQDLFVCSGGNGNVPDRLFINNGDGTFTNQAAAWGLTAIHRGTATAVGDYNNDGWLDIYVGSVGPPGGAALAGQNKLYRNNGDGTFTDVAAAAGVDVVNPAAGDTWTACFGDYDLDGDLDLYVGGFRTAAPSNAGNHLFRNNGNGTFTDVTVTIGLFSGVGNIANLSASFADMDGDHYPELLLGGDFKGSSFIGSRYFRNNGNGAFTDFTSASGTGQEENGMGQTLGDFNNDGRLDWYVTSIYGFPPSNWTGNKLYRNTGAHHYVEQADPAGCDDGGYGWGALASDFNHDGWLDIAETNGDGNTGGQYYHEQSYLWVNNGLNGTFTEMAVSSGLFHNGKGRGLLQLDYDNDGDMDVVILANNEPLNLYRNDLAGPDTHWLRVFLDTSKGSAGGPLAPNGYGALVRVTAGGVARMRTITGGNSFLGVSELSAQFGLGAATIIDELLVTWPNGDTTTLTNVAVDQTLTISSGSVCATDVNGDSATNFDDVLAAIFAWGPCAQCAEDVNGDGTVNFDDVLAIIFAWGPC